MLDKFFHFSTLRDMTFLTLNKTTQKVMDKMFMKIWEGSVWDKEQLITFLY